MKVLIVEDETAAYENLMDILTEITPDIRIMANTESVTQTVGWLQSNPAPDLIFMDIHLSDGSAFAIFDRNAISADFVHVIVKRPASMLKNIRSITADAWFAWIASVNASRKRSVTNCGQPRPGQQKQKKMLMQPHPRKSMKHVAISLP